MISAHTEGGYPQPRPKGPLNAEYVSITWPLVDEACAYILDKNDPELLPVFASGTFLDSVVVSGVDPGTGFVGDVLTLTLTSRAVPCLLSYTETDVTDPMDPIVTSLTHDFTFLTPTLILTGTEVLSYQGFVLTRVF